jgi:hypothetical protein
MWWSREATGVATTATGASTQLLLGGVFSDSLLFCPHRYYSRPFVALSSIDSIVIVTQDPTLPTFIFTIYVLLGFWDINFHACPLMKRIETVELTVWHQATYSTFGITTPPLNLISTTGFTARLYLTALLYGSLAALAGI